MTETVYGVRKRQQLEIDEVEKTIWGKQGTKDGMLRERDGAWERRQSVGEKDDTWKSQLV